MTNPELLFFNRARLLEGPCYDAKNDRLVFVSIRNNTIFDINLKNGDVRSYITEGPVGCAVVTDDGNLLEAEKDGIYKIDRISGKRTFITHTFNDRRMRYNDGKLDPCGRLLVGTMGDTERLPGEGKLYSVEISKDGLSANVRTLIEGTTVSNGLGFSPDGKTMYFIDTPTKEVAAYDYSLSDGSISNRRTVAKIEGDGSPDGMCVDTDGTLLVAEWGGGRVCRRDPENGEILCEIPLPCKNVSSCCIGGERLDTLFITTAQGGDFPLAGGLFISGIRRC